jgi:TRAP-type mannitol/chloroaromatic compound transport system permease large subunit
MGLILERSGMAEDLLDTIGQLFGPIRGGLALAVIWWAPCWPPPPAWWPPR